MVTWLMMFYPQLDAGWKSPGHFANGMVTKELVSVGARVCTSKFGMLQASGLAVNPIISLFLHPFRLTVSVHQDFDGIGSFKARLDHRVDIWPVIVQI